MSGERGGIWGVLRFARVYDGLQAALGAELWRKALVLDHGKPAPGERVLDLGCGTGALRRYVRDADYLGVDINPGYIATAAARYPPADDWRVADVSDLARLEAGQFDLVMGAGLLHHLSDDDARALIKNSAALLKPGGRLAMIDPVFLERQRPVARLLARMDRGRHVRAPEEYRALLASVLADAEVTIRANLLRLPYDHAVSTGRAP